MVTLIRVCRLVYLVGLSYRCERFFCQMCLKGSYDQQIETVKDKKDWICPWCQVIKPS